MKQRDGRLTMCRQTDKHKEEPVDSINAKWRATRQTEGRWT